MSRYGGRASAARQRAIVRAAARRFEGARSFVETLDSPSGRLAAASPEGTLARAPGGSAVGAADARPGLNGPFGYAHVTETDAAAPRWRTSGGATPVQPPALRAGDRPDLPDLLRAVQPRGRFRPSGQVAPSARRDGPGVAADRLGCRARPLAEKTTPSRLPAERVVRGRARVDGCQSALVVRDADRDRPGAAPALPVRDGEGDPVEAAVAVPGPLGA